MKKMTLPETAAINRMENPQSAGDILETSMMDDGWQDVGVEK